MTIDRIDCDIAVIGGGPAGLAAAETAGRAGARVTLVDLFPEPGGQYHMQPPARLAALHASHQASEGRAARRRCEEAGVRFLTGAEVFWAEPGFRLLAQRSGNSVRIDSRAMVAATGAIERSLPFPSWTLPGVMTAGAAQRLVKTAGTPPGRRIVLAGSGPFLLAVASTLATAGIRLAAYVEAARPSLAALTLLMRHPARIGEAARLALGVLKTRPLFLMGHIVIEAIGGDRVEAVRVAPISTDGVVRADAAELIADVDALCIGYGFRPSLEITSVLKARHIYDERLGGWACETDTTTGATSVSGLYAAGEVAGIGGAEPARLGGILAGFHAARAFGFGQSPGVDTPLVARRLQRARDFAAGLAALFPHPASLLDIAAAGDIVCRCEDVTVGEILAAVDDGATDAFGIKMWTRAGMGPCQGRTCGPAIASLLSRSLGTDPAAIGFNALHLPIRPVPLDVAAEALKAGA